MLILLLLVAVMLPSGSLGLSFLSTAPALPASTLLAFERQGHVVTEALFEPDEIAQLKPPILQGAAQQEEDALRQKVHVLLGSDCAIGKGATELRETLDGLDPEHVPFLQVFNLWRTAGPHKAAVKALATSPRLTSVAAQLLGCKRLRLYQDSVFNKAPGNGPTLWHSDCGTAPFDTNDFVTCWIPLQPVPSVEEGGSGLTFASRSHRDFALSFWSDPNTEHDLSHRYEESPNPAMEVGDVSWHHGWTLHCAEGNVKMPPHTPQLLAFLRLAYAVSYIADGATKLPANAVSPHDEDVSEWGYNDWIGEVEAGAPVDHPYVPLVFDEAIAAAS
ncbi:unnamed protein product [Chrysoparadoxa australica]